MKITHSISFILIMLLCISNSYAQSLSVEQAVIDLFDKPSKVQWVKHYEGRVDDFNDVAVTLAYDGKHCKGQMKYLKSKTVFGLAGFIKNKKIRLQEINLNQDVSGFIEGKMDGKNIIAEWSSRDNSVAGNMVLKETKKPKTRPGHCGENKWIKMFSGTIERRDVEMTLQLEGEGMIWGTAYFYKHDKTFEIKGIRGEKNKLELYVYNANALLVGTITGYITDKGIIDAGFVGPDGKQQMCSFWKQKELILSCVEYTDYLGGYDVTYPSSTNKAVNEWIKSTSNKWLKARKEEARKVKKVNKSITPDDRASVRVYGWCDLDLVSPKVMSGAMIMQSTWQSNTEVEAFNFDLEKNKEIKLEDLFDKDFDYQKFVWAFLSDDIKEHKYYEDYGYRKWLGNVLFENFTIRKDGLNFSTAYNPIYGQYKITVPYHELKSHFKKKSPIWRLVDIEKD